MVGCANPVFLWLLLSVPLLAWIRFRFRKPSSIDYSSVMDRLNLQPSLRQRLAFIPFFLFLASLAAAIVALARPQRADQETIIHSEGIAIELVVDRSSSMNALDFELDDRRVDRLSAIKDVAITFVLGGKHQDVSPLDPLASPSQGRIGDRIGLIRFAGFADAVTPLSMDHRFLVKELSRTKIVDRREEDGTAIGDALSLAVEKLQSLKSSLDDPIKSKVVILLTDGENTRGDIDPEYAAELAKQYGMKVYTIGVGTKGRAPVPVRRTRSGQIIVEYVEVNIDEVTLKSIAEKTGGQYFRATDTTSLAQIYDQIDQLEKTEFTSEEFVSYREWAIEPFRWHGFSMPPILAIASVLLTLSVLLSHTVFRELTA